MNIDHAKWSGVKLVVLSVIHKETDEKYYLKINTVFDNRYIVEVVTNKQDASVFNVDQAMDVVHDLRYNNCDIALFKHDQQEELVQLIKNDIVEVQSEQI